MKKVSVTIPLKLASFSDLFSKNGNGNIIENVQLFFKSIKTDKFEGPYSLSSTNSYLELMCQLGYRMIYVLDFERSETAITEPLKITLKEAVFNDISFAPKYLRTNLMYFLKATATNVQGPFYMEQTPNLEIIKKYIKEKKMYVLSRNQKFQFINSKKIVA